MSGRLWFRVLCIAGMLAVWMWAMGPAQGLVMFAKAAAVGLGLFAAFLLVTHLVAWLQRRRAARRSGSAGA